ncbi:MAG: thiopurine S-methyltransferase [Marinovum sp.]|nr:thiopurine S-methyltransferase [Marinovum sp.]
MDEAFWQARWSEGRIGFHEPAPNSFLTAYFDTLGLSPGDHVFVPLCGKTRDIDWLLERGHRVSGIEFNREAVEAVFVRLGVTPEITADGDLTKFSASALTLWHGDFFKLTQDNLGSVNAVYDRAALVALPTDLRDAYAKSVPRLTNAAPQLLISFDYDQSQMSGPPFSVPEGTIREVYDETYTIDLVVSQVIDGPLGLRCSGREEAWLLHKR